MVLSWFRKRRRKRLLALPLPAGWREHFEALPFFRSLSEDERLKLTRVTRVFVTEKRWEGCSGLELTDEIRVTVGAQACLLILNLDHAYYSRVRTILVYPSSYVARSPDGRAQVREGESWEGGPVVLAWDSSHRGGRDPDDGHNLVFHEFAHKLDTLDGVGDGTPLFGDRKQFETWSRVVGQEFERHVRNIARRKKTFLREYGAENPAEFFAVATETFFERPRKLKLHHDELYDCLAAFYRQDPVSRRKR